MTPRVRNVITSFLAATALSLTMAAPVDAAVNKKSLQFQEQAQKHLKRKDASSAVIQLKNAIKADASNLEARVQLGEIYLAGNEPLSAEKEFKAARAGGFSADYLASRIAHAYLLQGRFKDVIDEFSEPLDDEHLYATLLVYRAQALASLEKLDEAGAAVDQALALNPELNEAFVIKSRVLSLQGEMEAAEMQVDAALSADPKNVEALIQKGDLRRQASDLDEAISHLTRAVTLAPLNEKARLFRAQAYLADQNYEKARDDADVILERNEQHPIAAYLKAFSLTFMGDRTEALETLTKSTGTERYAPARLLLSELNLGVRNFSQARLHIDRFLAEYPNHAGGMILSGAIFLAEGEPQVAVDLIDPVNAQIPGNLKVVTLLAAAYSALGDHSRAAELYNEATEIDPENEEVRFRLAREQMGSGALSEAVQELSILAQGGEADPRAQTMLILTYMRQGDLEMAAQAAQKLKEMEPGSPLPENFLASLAISRGQNGDAKRHLLEAMRLDENFHAAAVNYARLLISESDYVAAERQFSLVLEKKSNHLPAIMGLVDIAERAGETKRIAELLDQAVRGNPKSPSAHLARVNRLLAIERNERALAAARDFVNELPDNLNGMDALGRAQMAGGQTSSALVTYKRLAARIPSNPLGQFRLGKILEQAKQPAQAKDAYEKALRINTDFDDARRAMIDLEQRSKGQAAAIVMARQLYNRIADPLKRKIGLGNVLVALGAQQEGLALLQSAYQSGQERGGLVSYHRALMQAAQYGRAEQVLREWLAENDDDNAVRFMLFSQLINEKRYDVAITEGETMDAQKPGDPVVMNNLGWLYQVVGRHDQAREFAQRAYEQAPNSAELADTYGWILTNQGEAAEAVELLEMAHKKLKDRHDITYHYAVALKNVGQKNAARNVVRALLNSTPETFDDRAAAEALLKELGS